MLNEVTVSLLAIFVSAVPATASDATLVTVVPVNVPGSATSTAAVAADEHHVFKLGQCDVVSACMLYELSVQQMSPFTASEICILHVFSQDGICIYMLPFMP
jgi:hypothetical protein